MNKKIARIRRATRNREKMRNLNATRLVVHRTLRHIYAQVISSDTAQVLAYASTVEKCISAQLRNTSNKNAAAVIGKIIAERSLVKGIQQVSFDRSGFKYHGRIKTLAEAARNTGLQF